MIVQIPDVLSAEQVRDMRVRLQVADWVDGLATAGHQGARVKRNRQLAEGSPLARELGDVVLAALERHPLFISAVLPARVYPPLFNRYEGGERFGNHVDNALRLMPGSAERLRTDVSATLFLSDPDDYDGGELLIDDTYGAHSVKLPAGHLIVYPSASLHRVEPVTRGARLACFFWAQSMVRDVGQRTLLLDLDTAIQRLAQTDADEAARLQLTGCYHNLLRMWAQA
ncbi:MAG TPA: Fe2+-dependent dioxygenase [Burkholderiaceae bacterium]|jgi:PKHD-type hydroxylase|nr:Fe2+-dependent dioxygenase [Burkholderiaceae bacterium]